MAHHQEPSMRDQAEALRKLVAQRGPPALVPLRADRRHSGPSAPRAQLVVVAGGKGGVGATTLAVNIAAAAAQSGRRCLLVDVDGECGDVASLTAVRERHTVADVLAQRRRLVACLQHGPAGVMVLAGAWGFERLSDHPPAAADVLIQQIFEMSDELDLAVFDCGNSRGSMTERFWRAADVVMAVGSVEPASILDTYSAIKQMYHRRAQGRLVSVVNMAPHRAAADSVHQRLREACRRFLAIPVTAAGAVRHDEAVVAANRCGMPVVLRSPDCQAAKDIRALAEFTLCFASGAKGANAEATETLKIRAGGSR
jgi:flagellar biosynthesis protein FlhG